MTGPHEGKLPELLKSIRQEYIDQFQKSISDRTTNKGGQSEVTLQLNGQSGLHRDLYCADFITGGESSEIIEFQPTHQVKFDALITSLEETSVTLNSMRWDLVTISFHGVVTLPHLLDAWFEKWFDPDDHSRDSNVPLSGTIHSLSVDDMAISLDMGTAPVEAFWELLDTFEIAGVGSLLIDHRSQNA